MAASLCVRSRCRLPAHFLQLRGLSASSLTSPSPVQKSVNDSQIENIVIPLKKKRTATAILQVLASTVKRDPNSPHYKYIDDPYLIPTSAISKRSYALSKESGQKAARYVLENYSMYFNTNPAEPPIKDFMPPKVSYNHKEPSESALLERIERHRVKDAVDVYKQIKQKRLDLSEETCLKFLELLCVYNAEDPPKIMMQEEFFFRRDLGLENKKPVVTWKNNGIAERVFDELKTKTPQSYEHLIRGMARYLETDRAFQLYDEMKEKKMTVGVLTYNELIRAATFHKDTYDAKWQQVQHILMDMQLAGVRPDLATFNGVLYSLRTMSVYSQSRILAMQTLCEMKKVGIEPSLGSWKYILSIFYPKESSESNMLHKIMDELEGHKFEMKDPNDQEFFVNAMKICFLNLHDLELGYRIDNLVNTGNNAQLLGDNRLQSMYYSFLVRLVCMFETMDKVMEVYQRVTPHLFTPNHLVIHELLKAIELQDGFKYLPLIWTDFILFEFMYNQDLLEKLLELMAKRKQEPELQSQYVHIAGQFIERWKDEKEERRPASLSTATMISHLITIAENGDDHNLAWTAFDICRNNKNMFAGSVSDESIQKLVKCSIELNEGAQVVTALQLMEATEMAGVPAIARLALESDKLTLTQSHKDTLSRF